MARVKLNPIRLPLQLPARQLTPLVLAMHQVHAEGELCLREGHFLLPDGETELCFDAGTRARLQMDFRLRAALQQDGSVALWPRVERARVESNQPIRFMNARGTDVKLRSFELGGGSEENLDKHIGLEVLDTLGLALAKLSARPESAPVEVADPTTLIEQLQLERATIELLAGAELELADQRLKLARGQLRLHEVSLRPADRELSGQLFVDMALQEGSELRALGLRLQPTALELKLATLIEHRRGQLFVATVSGETGRQGGLTLRDAQLCLPADGGELRVREAQLQIRSMTLGEGEQGAVIEGDVALGQGQLRQDRARLDFGGGQVERLRLASLGSDDNVTLKLHHTGLTDVAVQLGAEQGGQLRFTAERLKLSNVAAASVGGTDSGIAHVDLEASRLHLLGSDGKGLQAQCEGASRMVLESANLFGPGARRADSLVGLRMEARWDRIAFDDGHLPIVLRGADLGVRLLSDRPLEAELSLAVDSIQLSDLQQELARSTLRLRVNEARKRGRMSASLRVPIALLLEALQRELPEVLRLEVDAPNYPLLRAAVDAVALARLGPRGFSHGARPRLRLESRGHDRLQLSSAPEGLLLEGVVELTLLAEAELISLGSALRSVGPSLLRRPPRDGDRRGQLELMRLSFQVPVRGHLKLGTNAPASLADFTLNLSPSLQPRGGIGELPRRLGQRLVDYLAGRALRLSVGELALGQLGIAPALKTQVRSAQLALSGDAVAVELEAEVEAGQPPTADPSSV